MILTAEGISKSYGIKDLFHKINLTVNEKDKIGIIGNNGTGKTTLLKALAGLEEPDEGTIRKSPLLKISYLSQNIEANEELTVFDEARRGAEKKMDDLQEHEVKTILTKLGFRDFQTLVKDLSGGQKRRLALASALIRPADLLILDEATNHLDGEMILWLEKYLINYPKAIILVTHDRYFLERIVNKIVELENGNISEYPANYSKYLDLKIEKDQMQEANQRKMAAFLRKELIWISRGAQARETKDRRRIEQFEKMSQTEIVKKSTLVLESTASRLGNKIIELDHVSKSYSRILVNDFTFVVPKEARIGIVGGNGCGKTTLLRMMAGTVKPDSGEVQIGKTVKVGFFAQENEALDDSLRIIDFVRNIAEVVKSGKNIYTAVQMIEKFCFDNPYSLIGTLSGGEKRRLMLLALLMASPNVLLLDEPTNNLDIATMNIFESYLEDFQGAVIVASHDRYFLDKICDRFFVFADNGHLEPHLGSFSQFLASKKPSAEKETVIVPTRTKKQTVRKLTFKEQQEYSEIENIISELEKRLETVTAEIKKNYENYSILKDLYEKKSAIDAELEEKITRWGYLTEIDENSNVKI